MGTCGSVIKEKKTFNENEKKDKKIDKDYIPENLTIGQKRVIPFNEINRIQKKLDTICKILKENGIQVSFVK